MKTPILFKEYLWLITTIADCGPISLAEINRKWVLTEMSEGNEIPRSTFNRHKDAIQDIFGVNIDCDIRGGYKYYISNEDALADGTIQSWIINSLSTGYALSDNLGLHGRILLEPASGNPEMLRLIMQAMKENRRLRVVHQKYTSREPKTYTFDPYAVKFCQGRWYVLAHFQRPAREGEVADRREGLPEGYVDYYVTFALDRMLEAEILEETFAMDRCFDAGQFFSECYGIVHGDGQLATKIVIRAFETEAFYMADLPWHHSQNILAYGEDYVDFEFFIRPTADFATKILSRGNMVRVVEPQWLAEVIKQMHQDAIDEYN